MQKSLLYCSSYGLLFLFLFPNKLCVLLPDVLARALMLPLNLAFNLAKIEFSETCLPISETRATRCFRQNLGLLLHPSLRGPGQGHLLVLPIRTRSISNQPLLPIPAAASPVRLPTPASSQEWLRPSWLSGSTQGPVSSFKSVNQVMSPLPPPQMLHSLATHLKQNRNSLP